MPSLESCALSIASPNDGSWSDAHGMLTNATLASLHGYELPEIWRSWGRLFLATH